MPDVSPGRSVIRRGPRARRKCESRHNSCGPWPRPLSREFAESQSNVAVTGWRTAQGGVGDERRPSVHSSSESVSSNGRRCGCQLTRLGASKHDVNQQTDDCELTETGARAGSPLPVFRRWRCSCRASRGRRRPIGRERVVHATNDTSLWVNQQRAAGIVSCHRDCKGFIEVSID